MSRLAVTHSHCNNEKGDAVAASWERERLDGIRSTTPMGTSEARKNQALADPRRNTGNAANAVTAAPRYGAGDAA